MSASDGGASKPASIPLSKQNGMIDLVEINVKAGDGGKGCVSFRREKFVPRGGPNGGNGGRGGCVYAVGSRSVSTLIDQRYQKHYEAQRGSHGMGKNAHGMDGSDIEIPLPVGSVLTDLDTEEIVGELLAQGDRLLLAEGGIGGRGNAEFKTSVYQAPRAAELGEPGQARRLRIEVKLIADVGFVGFPNAGKSTLLSVVSAAKPKIAPYPFTTLSPNLGLARVAAQKNFVAADLPGLIEGAHAGAGLGHGFLRHVERTRLLVHVVDASSADGRDPVEDIRALNRELALHSDRLADLPQLIALNKIDLPAGREAVAAIRSALGKAPVYPISAVRGEGVQKLLFDSYSSLQRILKREEESAEKAEADRRAAATVYRSKGRIQIQARGGGFAVESKQASRAVVMTDFSNDEAVWLMGKRLEQLGVRQALKRAGAKEGDSVIIGGREFVFSNERQPGSIAEFLAERRAAGRR